jgi:hypothetical protein
MQRTRTTGFDIFRRLAVPLSYRLGMQIGLVVLQSSRSGKTMWSRVP